MAIQEVIFSVAGIKIHRELYPEDRVNLWTDSYDYSEDAVIEGPHDVRLVSTDHSGWMTKEEFLHAKEINDHPYHRFRWTPGGTLTKVMEAELPLRQVFKFINKAARNVRRMLR